jgi:surfeit locus 1 family protein
LTASIRDAPRSRAALVSLTLVGLGLCAGLIALGNWQLDRRTWKLDLIARVEQRAHATPVAAPGPEQWAQVSAQHDEYRRVRLAGTFLHDRETLVQASTALGSGYWVLTPLKTADGPVVLINRGFVGPQRRDRASRGASGAPVTVIGLLRLTEPGGTLLRRNDPAHERWYSRDVSAISAARGLTGCAPFFVDAEAATAPQDEAGGQAVPVGGLTVIAFHNNHLVYAVTWYALALMVAVAAGYLVLVEGRLRREGDFSNKIE